MMSKYGTINELIALNSALEKQVAILKKRQVVWKDVREFMPQMNLGVLVFIPDEDNHITSGMYENGDWILLDEYRKVDVPVTHWAYMPSPPKATNNG